MKQYVNMLREFSIPLIAGVIAALLWVNILPESYHNFIYEPKFGYFNFHFVVNDLFMVFFFGIAAAEITKSCAPGGDLYPIKKAINPLLATVGGVLFPVIIYLLFNAVIGDSSLSRGWGIPTATDIALAWLVASVVFGKKHPAVSFLLLLAIADDAVGLVIIAIFYPDPSMSVAPIWLLFIVLGMGVVALLRRIRVQNYWPYILLGGGLTWAGLYKAHLHPALALVFIIPFLPHQQYERLRIFEEDESDSSTLGSFEREWKVLVDFGMFTFGLANAGVELKTVGTVTWLVLISLLVGKTSGIFTMGKIGEKLGYPLPKNVGNKELVLIGVVAGIGLTVALFIAGEAFTDLSVQGAAKMGALLSFVAAIIAIVAGRILKIQRIK
ncbi:MAG: Na+/H+ antiporter NhaA [Desulfuromonadales bacterium]|nr:Na+/H+ antiporter NhaA [Desulfuromonadales bacterium]